MKYLYKLRPTKPVYKKKKRMHRLKGTYSPFPYLKTSSKERETNGIRVHHSLGPFMS